MRKESSLPHCTVKGLAPVLSSSVCSHQLPTHASLFAVPHILAFVHSFNLFLYSACTVLISGWRHQLQAKISATYTVHLRSFCIATTQHLIIVS